MIITSFIGYFLAILIGIVLGLVGGGGSILTVPVLVYLLGLNPILATGHSLFIVGVSSIIGARTYAKSSLVNVLMVRDIGIPALIVVVLVRKYLLPSIPLEFHFSGFLIKKDILLMSLFSILMIWSSLSMFFKPKVKIRTNKTIDYTWSQQWRVYLIAILLGVVSGLLGAGGGFLIIPTLVLLVGIDMKEAIGTSLVIISCNSIFGFCTDLLTGFHFDWNILIFFSGFTILGILFGAKIANRVSARYLRTGFGWMVLFVGLIILAKEIWA